MKVYFSVIGIGLGHMTRCLAIADKLAAQGVECIFSSYGKAACISKNTGYETHVSKPLMWCEDKEGQLDLEKTILNGLPIFARIVEHFFHEDRLMKKLKPDLVVCDSRYSTIPASKNLYVPRVYITNQPKVYMPNSGECPGDASNSLTAVANRLNYNILAGQDKVLLPDFPLPHSISERHMLFQSDAPPKFIEKTCFVGPISHHRPGKRTTQEVEEVCRRYNVVPGEFVYIAFSGPSRIERNTLNTFLDVFPSYEIDSIMCKGDVGETRVDKKGNMRLVKGWMKDRDALMDAASTIVCRAGLSTLSEVLAFGKRAVVIPQPNQPEQESNTYGMEKLGVAKGIRPENVNARSLKEALFALESSSVSESASRMKTMASQWKGEENSARIIMELLEGSGAGE